MNTYFGKFNHLVYRDESAAIYFINSVIIGRAAIMLVGVVFVALIAACTVEYSKMTTIQGRTVSEKGIIKIYSNVGGVVTRIHVSDGNRIESGEELFVIKPYSEAPANLGGKSVPASLIGNLEDKKFAMNSVAYAKREALDKAISLLVEKRKDLLEQIALVKEEHVEHEAISQRAHANFEKHYSLIERGFVSKSTLTKMEDDLSLQRKSGLHLMRQRKELEMQLQSINGQIEENEINKIVLENQHKQDILGNEAESIGLKLRDELVIRAPSSGVIHNISTSAGDAIQQRPLAMLMPENSLILGEALIPSRQIGFIQIGQEVRMRYFAYPYQKYGTFKAVVVNIGSIPVFESSAAEGTGDLNFKVLFKLDDQILNVGGRGVGLVPGMSFNADIKTDKRLIVEWILEPIISLKRLF